MVDEWTEQHDVLQELGRVIPHALEVAVVYYSRFGAVRRLAERIAEGVRRVPGVAVDLLPIGDEPVGPQRAQETETDAALRRGALMDRLAGADALIVGAPTYLGSMASPAKRLFEDLVTGAGAPPAPDASRPWRHYEFRDKVGAAFTSSATPHGGNEQTLHSILTMLMHLGMIVVTPGLREPLLEGCWAPYGATLVARPGAEPAGTAEEDEAARALGERVATVATWLRCGRTEAEKVATHSSGEQGGYGVSTRGQPPRAAQHRPRQPPA